MSWNDGKLPALRGVYFLLKICVHKAFEPTLHAILNSKESDFTVGPIIIGRPFQRGWAVWQKQDVLSSPEHCPITKDTSTITLSTQLETIGMIPQLRAFQVKKKSLLFSLRPRLLRAAS